MQYILHDALAVTWSGQMRSGHGWVVLIHTSPDQLDITNKMLHKSPGHTYAPWCTMVHHEELWHTMRPQQIGNLSSSSQFIAFSWTGSTKLTHAGRHSRTSATAQIIILTSKLLTWQHSKSRPDKMQQGILCQVR